MKADFPSPRLQLEGLSLLLGDVIGLSESPSHFVCYPLVNKTCVFALKTSPLWWR